MSRLVTIEAYALRLPYCGFVEFVTQLGRGIARRSRELAEQYDLRFRFVVPKGMAGVFGIDVDYIEVTDADKPTIEKRTDWQSDLYHVPTQYSTFRHMRRCRAKLVTVHDVNFVHNKRGLSLLVNWLRVRSRIRSADYLAFISRYAMADTLAHYKLSAPRRVIYNGVTDTMAATESTPVDGLQPGRFLLHLSNMQSNKNVDLLVQMTDYLPASLGPLVLAGAWAHASERLRHLAAERPDRVIVVGSVSEAQKIWLYRSCRAFLFPSQCEGFGLPPLEAMSAGRPAFLSGLTSLPEVGGDAAFYFHTLEPEIMAADVVNGLAHFDADPYAAARCRTQALQFNWDQCVDGYIRYYCDILG